MNREIINYLVKERVWSRPCKEDEVESEVEIFGEYFTGVEAEAVAKNLNDYGRKAWVCYVTKGADGKIREVDLDD